jgi:peptide/nickel transport system permease protein
MSVASRPVPAGAPPTAQPVRRLSISWMNRKLGIGLGLLSAVILFGLIGPFFWDTELAYVGSSPRNLPPIWSPRENFPPPQPTHPLGTESMGRDMLALIIVGTPSSLKVGFIAATIGMGVGLILGSLAGYLGGRVDNVVRIISDSVITIPALAVLVVLASYIKMTDTTAMAFILALFAWPGPTRVVRAQVLTLRERGYVRMAMLSGAASYEIMFIEMLPNMLPWLAASFTGTVSATILGATALEVLGLGPTRVPSLGLIINQATAASALLRGMTWWWFPPILMLMIIFTSFFLITVGLDEVANPRLKGVKA